MRVYFMGSHCTGKTTLCRYVSQKYNLPMITEVARSVMSELELPLERIRTDLSAVDQYQKKVFERQVQVEKSKGDSFVSDRAFDNLGYAAEHSRVFRDLMKSPELENYLDWVAKGTVFFLRPDRRLLVEDGTREKINWEGAVRIDGMVKLLLEFSGIPYMPIETSSMQERCRIIDFVLRK